jgi:hypothetical protein
MLAFGLLPCASQIKLSQEMADSQMGTSVISKLSKNRPRKKEKEKIGKNSKYLVYLKY